MKLIFATHNPGKLIEMQALLSDLDIEVQSAYDLGLEEPIEDGKTLEENSLIKARYVSEKIGEWAVADDTGIFIKALDGAPGIRCSRWFDGDKAKYTLDKMKDVPVGERQAYFETVSALVSPEGKEWIFRGKIDGTISLKAIGKSRPKLPYDLVFIPDGEKRTFSEMTDEEKNQISHRGIAFRKLREFLEKI
ncbi:RdgB/HAM1 family non-canonical purine NTP pyrophosphatase [Patescibacteria group bacterium]|nr:RdgB/HAM1 family non-canonical purine NTP pyrophosphatase [Patescibacteria group bacterium]MBU1890836.1 RdgB/HAM1 family non-canonical purine NTP pyrophosphatase [Patescibacteria group bacterium]